MKDIKGIIRVIKLPDGVFFSDELYQDGIYKFASVSNVVDTSSGELNTSFFEDDNHRNEDGIFIYNGERVGNKDSRPKEIFGRRYIQAIAINPIFDGCGTGVRFYVADRLGNTKRIRISKEEYLNIKAKWLNQEKTVIAYWVTNPE